VNILVASERTSFHTLFTAAFRLSAESAGGSHDVEVGNAAMFWMGMVNLQ
jgi:hypothetical protein